MTAVDQAALGIELSAEIARRHDDALRHAEANQQAGNAGAARLHFRAAQYWLYLDGVVVGIEAPTDHDRQVITVLERAASARLRTRAPLRRARSLTGAVA